MKDKKCECGAAVRKDGKHHPECPVVDLAGSISDLTGDSEIGADVAPIVMLGGKVLELITKHGADHKMDPGQALFACLLAASLYGRELKGDQSRDLVRRNLVQDMATIFDVAMMLVDQKLIDTRRFYPC